MSPAAKPAALVARTAWLTLSALAAAGCAATTTAWFTDQPAILAQLSPFRLQYAVLLAGHALFCLMLRHRLSAAAFALFAMLNTIAIRPHGRPAAASAESTPTLRILYANVQSENTDPAPLFALIAREQPDLIALLEVNTRWDQAVTQHCNERYPHRFALPSEDNFGLALYSRHPLTRTTVEYLADPDYASLAASVSAANGHLRLLLTHPPPPGDDESVDTRNRQIAAIGEWITPAAAQNATVALGDFNATPWCPPLRALLGRPDIRSAQTGHGFYAATWPANLPHIRIPIDHVLLGGGLQSRAFRVGPDIGSDHFPLIVDLGLIGPGGN